MSKTWCDYGQFSVLIVNISGTEQDMNYRNTALQTAISPACYVF